MSNAAALGLQLGGAVYKNEPIASIQRLLHRGADINAEYHHQTGLAWAAYHGNTQLCALLLDNGADRNALSSFSSSSSLLLAAMAGKLETCRLLIARSCDLSLRDKQGLTPLHQSASRGHLDVCNLLLQHQADPRVKSNKGFTPLDFARARKFGDVVALLEKAMQPAPKNIAEKVPDSKKRKREDDSDDSQKIHALIERAALAEGKLEVERRGRERAENELKVALERCVKAETLKKEEEKRCKEATSRAVAAEKLVAELKEKAEPKRSQRLSKEYVVKQERT